MRNVRGAMHLWNYMTYIYLHVTHMSGAMQQELKMGRRIKVALATGSEAAGLLSRQ